MPQMAGMDRFVNRTINKTWSVLTVLKQATEFQARDYKTTTSVTHPPQQIKIHLSQTRCMPNK